jgi:tRNA threonylcarbamoyladenosine biosynthesis protein TsaE
MPDRPAPAPRPAGRARHLPDEAATEAAGRRLGAALAPGDCVLLEGPLGAGKSCLARAAIRAALGRPRLEVPSPSYTLVNVYEGPAAEIWHADLYRLSDSSELVELGLEEAFETAICLVEWPDRLGDLAPPGALSIRFEPGPEETARRLTLSWTDPRWAARLEGLAEPAHG